MSVIKEFEAWLKVNREKLLNGKIIEFNIKSMEDSKLLYVYLEQSSHYEYKFNSDATSVRIRASLYLMRIAAKL